VVLDGDVLPADPQTFVVSGGAKDVDLLVCATRDEVQLYEVMQGVAFVPADEAALAAEMVLPGLLDAYRQRHPGESLTRLRTRFLTDAIYRLPAARLASAQVRAGGRAWSSLQSVAPLGPTFGACHGSDMAFVLDGTAALGPVTPISPELLPVRDQMMAAWRGFLHAGDPGWPVYEPEKPTTFEYGGAGGLIIEPTQDAVAALLLTTPLQPVHLA
jgi:para-nitrobenzyl esterase